MVEIFSFFLFFNSVRLINLKTRIHWHYVGVLFSEAIWVYLLGLFIVTSWSWPVQQNKRRTTGGRPRATSTYRTGYTYYLDIIRTRTTGSCEYSCRKRIGTCAEVYPFYDIPGYSRVLPVSPILGESRVRVTLIHTQVFRAPITWEYPSTGYPGIWEYPSTGYPGTGWFTLEIRG